MHVWIASYSGLVTSVFENCIIDRNNVEHQFSRNLKEGWFRYHLFSSMRNFNLTKQNFFQDNFQNIFPLPFNSATFEWKRQSGQWIIRKFSFMINSSNKSWRRRNFSAYLEENSWRTSAGPKDASQYIKSFINRVRNRDGRNGTKICGTVSPLKSRGTTNPGISGQESRMKNPVCPWVNPQAPGRFTPSRARCAKNCGSALIHR